MWEGGGARACVYTFFSAAPSAMQLATQSAAQSAGALRVQSATLTSLSVGASAGLASRCSNARVSFCPSRWRKTLVRSLYVTCNRARAGPVRGCTWAYTHGVHVRACHAHTCRARERMHHCVCTCTCACHVYNMCMYTCVCTTCTCARHQVAEGLLLERRVVEELREPHLRKWW